MSHRCVLVLGLLLSPSLLSAAAPQFDPLPAVETRLKKDVGNRAALHQLIAFAATDGDAGGDGLRTGNVLRARQLLRRLLAAQPRRREAVVKVLLQRVRESLPNPDVEAGAALVLLREAATPAERLALAAEASGTKYVPLADLLLQDLRRSDDRTQRARAVQGLAKLHTATGMLPDALAWYRRLGGEHAKDIVEGKNTGADLFADLETDRRFLALLEPAAPLPTRFDVNEERGQFGTTRVVLSAAGEVEPFFLNHRVKFDFQKSSLQFMPRGQGPHYEPEITKSAFRGVVLSPKLGPRARFLYQTLGHVVFVQLGEELFAFDFVNRSLTWQRRLLPINTKRKLVEAVGVGDGTIRVSYDDRTEQLLGMELPLTAECLVLPVHDRLIGVDPLTGLTLWSRPEKPGSFLFHDGVNVYAVRRGNDGKATSTAAFRMSDGEAVQAKDFAELLNGARGIAPGGLLVSEPGEKKALTFRLVNPATRRDVWRLSFAEGSMAVESLKPELTGVVEPDGTFHLIEAATGKGLWKATLRKEKTDRTKPLEGVRAVRLVADPTYVFLAFEKDLAKGEKVAGPWKSLFQAFAGPAIPVHGKVHAYERQGGRFRWCGEFTGQTLFVGREAEALPMLALASRAPRRRGEKVVDDEQVQVVHKHTGRTFYHRGDGDRQWKDVFEVEADADGRGMHLVAEKGIVKLTPKK